MRRSRLLVSGPKQTTKMFTSPVRLAIIGALIAFLVPLTLLLFSNWYSTAARVFVQVSALSERISFRVTQPNLAAFLVRNMRARSSVRAVDGTCINGLIKPALNAEVIFGRAGYEPLSIELHPPRAGDGRRTGDEASGLLTTAEPGHSTVLSGDARLEWEAGCEPKAGREVSVNNAPASPPPLPIWGPLSIGSEFSGYSGTVQTPKMMTEGRVTLQARSVAIPFLLARSWYTVTALDLPVGARVEAYRGDTGGTSAEQEIGKTGEEATWWGRVYVDPQRPNLVVAAATYTPRLAVYRPNLKDAEVVELKSLAQMFGDPNLVVAYKAATSLVVVFALLQFWLDRRAEGDRRGGR